MRLICALLLVLPCFTATSHAQDFLIHRHMQSGGMERFLPHVVSYRAPKQVIASIPEWEPTEAAPAPLSRDEAVKIAKAAAAKRGTGSGPEPGIIVTLCHSRNTDTLKSWPARSCRWFYVVVLNGDGFDPPGKYHHVILMNGTVATAEVEVRRQ